MKHFWEDLNSATRTGLDARERVSLWRISLLVSIGILLMLGMYLPHRAHSSSLSQQNKTQTMRPLKISNLTQSLQVSDVQRTRQEARLSLQNNYKKDIAAFTITAGTYSVTLDFTPDVFRAGTTHLQSLTIPITNNAEDEISIVAILFEDQTGDGNPKIFSQMLERRSAEKLQLLRILPLINGALNVSENQLSESLAKAEKAALELPDSTNSGGSFEFRAGLHDARERILSDLRTIKLIREKHDGLMLQRQLRYFESRYERKISKLPD